MRFNNDTGGAGETADHVILLRLLANDIRSWIMANDIRWWPRTFILDKWHSFLANDIHFWPLMLYLTNDMRSSPGTRHPLPSRHSLGPHLSEPNPERIIFAPVIFELLDLLLETWCVFPHFSRDFFSRLKIKVLQIEFVRKSDFPLFFPRSVIRILLSYLCKSIRRRV